MGRARYRCDWLAVWILGSAWCSLAGWALSAVSMLDRIGYALAIAVLAIILILLRRQLVLPTVRPVWLLRRSTYARGLLPKLWLAGLVLIVAGGMLYHPDDYDYLTYRFSRVLHWTWARHWFWIDTVDPRQNISGVGMEWMMEPLFVFFRSDRPFFLINLVSYLFLPPLVFSVARQLGVGCRMAWNWMWLLPFGYCFVLQAGSMANDTFAAAPFLAALYYARIPRSMSLAPALSIIAMALVTGSKASNMPLVLPWLAIVWANRGAFFAAARPVMLAAAFAVAIACSFLPLGLVNLVHTGSYTGDPANTFALQLHSPVAGIVGNSAEILAGSLGPPFWPHAYNLDFLPASTHAWLVRDYPRYAAVNVPFQIEDNAGIGLGVTVMVVASILAGLLSHRRGGVRSVRRGTLLFAVATALAWVAYMGKMGSEAAPRLVAVYYVAGLLALLALLPEDGALPRSAGWRVLAALVMAVVLPLLILNPSRPLLPPALIARLLTAAHAPASAVAQLQNNYTLRASRRDILHPLRTAISPSASQIEVIDGLDDPEVSLWLPFGSREVVRGHPELPGSLRGHEVVVSEGSLQRHYHLVVGDLLGRESLRVVAQQRVVFKTQRSPETFYLLAPDVAGVKQ